MLKHITRNFVDGIVSQAKKFNLRKILKRSNRERTEMKKFFCLVTICRNVWKKKWKYLLRELYNKIWHIFLTQVLRVKIGFSDALNFKISNEKTFFWLNIWLNKSNILAFAIITSHYVESAVLADITLKIIAVKFRV